MGNVTAASAARWTRIAGFCESCVIAVAGAEMTFGIVYVKPNHRNPMHVHPNLKERE